MANDNRLPLTVVIPTLGGESLQPTIDALNSGSSVPSEILVCIPAAFTSRIRSHWDNVRVVVTECKGQVAQRAVGFRNASTQFVMQLDDDLFVERDCVRHLLEAVQRHGPNAAVAPSLVDRATGESIYRRAKRSPVADAIYNLLMNGTTAPAYGKVLKSGGAVGVDPKADLRDIYRVEWVPGGCVMHYRVNLVLEDFFPFRGKAYCEDIIHSHHLTSRGVALFVEPRALCSVEVASDSNLMLHDFVRSVIADYHPRRHYMRLTGRRPQRLAMFILSRFISYTAARFGRRAAEAFRN